MRCRDEGARPGCLGKADPRYTMPFDDIGRPSVYWCAFCGPEAHAMNAALSEALKDDDFREEFQAAVKSAEKERTLH